MGLDTSHGCWHGGYASFMAWRQKLAEVAGYPPLMLMEGFYDPKDFWCFPPGGSMYSFPTEASGVSQHRNWSTSVEQVCAALPIPWTYFERDPLTTLLNHSDDDGIIRAADCGPLADRLTELLPLLPEGNGGGHIGEWRQKTQTFIDGLREAAAANEDVEFR